MKSFSLMATQAMEEVAEKVREHGYSLREALRESPVNFTRGEIAQMLDELGLENINERLG